MSRWPAGHLWPMQSLRTWNHNAVLPPRTTDESVNGTITVPAPLSCSWSRWRLNYTQTHMCVWLHEKSWVFMSSLPKSSDLSDINLNIFRLLKELKSGKILYSCLSLLIKFNHMHCALCLALALSIIAASLLHISLCLQRRNIFRIYLFLMDKNTWSYIVL